MESKKVVVIFTREGIGQAVPELQQRLLGNYLHALEAERRMPSTICFYAEGVRLVIEGSPVLANLRTLAALGVELIACRTCLDYYGLTDRVAVGTVGTMADIVNAQFTADSVITP